MPGTGLAFLLKVGDGGSPPTFTTIAGLRITRLSVAIGAGEIGPQNSGDWPNPPVCAGTRSVTLAGTGVFTGAHAEIRLKAAMLAGTIDTYRASFDNGQSLTGRFLIASLDLAGDYNGERTYALVLASAGEVIAA